MVEIGDVVGQATERTENGKTYKGNLVVVDIVDGSPIIEPEFANEG